MAQRGPHIQLKLSWDKRGIKAKRAHFPTGSREREMRRGKEENQASSKDLQSFVDRFSSG